MIRVVRELHALSALPAYRNLLMRAVPEIARFDPGHNAVMMGYDFHLTPEGPKLIEVNTNAGGGILAYLSHVPDADIASDRLPQRLEASLLDSFSEEMLRFSGGKTQRPRTIAIIDEKPEEQFLHSEMQAFARLFDQWGCETRIVDPQGLEGGAQGVFVNGCKIDLIYNRHCDFYLESAGMQGLKTAYLARKVCLTPNPFTYALLADKRRMILWSDPEALAGIGLAQPTIDLLRSAIPRSRLLAGMNPEEVWAERKDLVFKPVSRFGSRGVFLGRKISKSRFATLPPEETLVQRLAPPSLTPPDNQSISFKTDLRLYAYRHKILGVAARLYQGQVTNMSTEGGGFAPVRIT